jgi:hypothetical protein
MLFGIVIPILWCCFTCRVPNAYCCLVMFLVIGNVIYLSDVILLGILLLLSVVEAARSCCCCYLKILSIFVRFIFWAKMLLFTDNLFD